MIKENFFFYGSLMKYPPESSFVVNRLAGTVHGTLHIFNRYFPAAVLKEGGDEKIHGTIVQYEFPEVEEHRLRWLLEGLDRFEGYSPAHEHLSHYLRVRRSITGEDGQTYRCLMYVINIDNPHPQLDRNLVIPEGDWEKWRIKKYGS